MSAATVAPPPASRTAPRGSFALALHAEWTKFRTVRGWIAGIFLAAILTTCVTLLNHSSCGGQVSPEGPVITGAGCTAPTGPGGEPVSDSFYFAHQKLSGNGSITTRVTDLASAGQQSAGSGGLPGWAKAGIIIKASDRPGSAYAAVLVTAGHGTRMQYDYTGDIAGTPGSASPPSPRWLRLTRAGAWFTGAASTDGRHWTTIGAVRLARFPSVAQAGLFATTPGGSPAGGSQSLTGSAQGSAAELATARFDRVTLSGAAPGQKWAGTAVGSTLPGEGLRQEGRAMAITGSGDIAPAVPGIAGVAITPPEQTLQGTFAGLITVVVVGALFITGEYRRGLIRLTLSASPARSQVLIAKVVVLSAVTFAAGLAGSAAALLIGEKLLRANGNYLLPVSTLTDIRLVTGNAALLAAIAVLALAIGAILRSGAATVTAVIGIVVLPYFFSVLLATLPAGPASWLLRVTPAAGFAVQQTATHYPQVAATYTPGNGYFPLPPWAGLAVLFGYVTIALTAATVLLRRRDA